MAMKQLSGMDATFLYMETPETPMHVAGMTMYELPEGFTGTFHAHFTAFFKTRVHLIPIFGKKLAKAVFQMDHPGWVDAGELDFDYHIKGAVLPKPGTQKQLEDMVAALHSEVLDRTRPLWQFTVIEGLESVQVCLYSKMHHAAIDGGAGMVITKALYDVTPEPRVVEPPKPKVAERKPTTPERAILGLNDIVSNVMRQQLKLMEGLPKAAGQLTDLIAPAITQGVPIPQLIAPKTPFNGTIGAARSYVARSISLSETKAICKATGVKLNDVVMAVCSGALRSYLDGKHQLPDAALIAFVPISIREAGNTDLNNQVFGMNCSLATNYGDPLKRLQKINAESRSSKMVADGSKGVAPSDYTVLGAPMLLPGLMQLYGQSKLADVLPNPVNVVISNTAGPPIPLYCAGAKVTALYPVSIPTHGVGLNFTVTSYLDKLDFGLTADAASVPDIEYLGELLVASFDELVTAVLGPRAEPEPVPAPAKEAEPVKTKQPTPEPMPETAEKPASKARTKAPAKTRAKTAPKASKAAPKPKAKAPAKPRARKPATKSGEK
ncbi:MAG: wax ester/triacylglycerol synthase family O-acyltransferase [Pikeienuella sp.]